MFLQSREQLAMQVYILVSVGDVREVASSERISGGYKWLLTPFTCMASSEIEIEI